MKFKVDQEKCVGCGACQARCPKVFKLLNDKSQVILDPVPADLQSVALAAEDACPVQAITHEE